MKNLYTIAIHLVVFLIATADTTCQSGILLDHCSAYTYSDHDRLDADGDGVLCEFSLTISNSASASDSTQCAEDLFYWEIDIEIDGVKAYNLSSELPSDDTSWDDTDGDGIPDQYVAPSLSQESISKTLPDIQNDNVSVDIRWQVADLCGHATSCEQSIHILDTKAPSPFCVSLYSLDFDGSDTTVYAEDFIVGAYDACTPVDELRYSFSSEEIVPALTVTCQDLLHSPLLEMVYSWDNQDNVEVCWIYLSVKPSESLDCIFDYTTVSGCVSTSNGAPIPNSLVTIYSPLPDYPQSTLTDGEGCYELLAPLSASNSQIRIQKYDDWSAGITLIDLVKIQNHILGIKPFTTVEKHIAADVNADCEIDIFDLLLLRKIALGVITDLPDLDSWRFFDRETTFGPELGPCAYEPAGETSLSIIAVDANIDRTYDFIGIKSGDINE